MRLSLYFWIESQAHFRHFSLSFSWAPTLPKHSGSLQHCLIPHFQELKNTDTKKLVYLSALSDNLSYRARNTRCILMYFNVVDNCFLFKKKKYFKKSCWILQLQFQYLQWELQEKTGLNSLVALTHQVWTVPSTLNWRIYSPTRLNIRDNVALLIDHRKEKDEKRAKHGPQHSLHRLDF